MKGKVEKVALKAADVIQMLRVKYPLPAFALLEQVADGTGARNYRWADALVMGVWPSRGYHLLGFEVKVSRSDWLHELHKPAKADALMKYCNGWYLAVSDEGIVQPGELPETWGMMAVKGGRIAIVKEAPKLTPQSFTPELVASVFRNMLVSDINALDRARAEGEKIGRESNRDYTAKQLKELSEQVQAFEVASGIKINQYCDGKELGEAVNIVHNTRWLNLDGAINMAKRVADELEKLKSVNLIQKLANEAQEAVKGEVV